MIKTSQELQIRDARPSPWEKSIWVNIGATTLVPFLAASILDMCMAIHWGCIDNKKHLFGRMDQSEDFWRRKRGHVLGGSGGGYCDC